MAKDAEAIPYTLKLWQKSVSLACIAGLPRVSVTFSLFSGVPVLTICCYNARQFSARSSWLDSTNLPNDCYLSSHVNTFLQLLYILATLEAVLCPVCTVTFSILISRRMTTYTEDILVLGLIAVSIVVAAGVLALQTVALNSSLDMQAISRIRPDLSSDEVLAAWNSSIDGCLSRVAFFLVLFVGGFQIVAVSARHLIPSPMRLPKQFQPFVMEKQKRTSAIGEPEASTGGTELVAGVDSGPLATLFDDYEKQGLISTHKDLESFVRKDFARPRSSRVEESERRRAFLEGGTEDRPQFALSDRYWGPQKHRGWLKLSILLSTVYFLLAVSFETVRFASTRKSSRPCQWLCNLGVLYPWPLAIWVVMVMISIQYRFALQREVLGMIRINRLLTISFAIFFLLGEVYAWARVYANSDDEDASVFPTWDILNVSFCTAVIFWLFVVELPCYLCDEPSELL